MNHEPILRWWRWVVVEVIEYRAEGSACILTDDGRLFEVPTAELIVTR
jgi:hypothetical protein